MGHKFNPEHAERLLRPERAEVQPVEPLVQLLDPKPGERHADVGCGPGYFALPVAERVRPDGRVYALDISPEMLAMCRERARARGLDAVVVALQNDEHKLPLNDDSLDGAWLANVFHELDDPVALLGELRRALKPGGRLVVVDWKPVEMEIGPPLEHRVPVEAVVRALREAGFEAIREHALYEHHYAVTARRPLTTA